MKMGWPSFVLVIAVCVTLACCQQTGELLSNPQFELPINDANWKCFSCVGRLVKESFKGDAAFLAAKRTQERSGLQQTLNVKQVKVGQGYSFTSRVKIRNSKTTVIKPQKFAAYLLHTFADKTRRHQKIAERLDVSLSDKWVELGADLVVQDFGKTLKALTLQIVGPAPNINFLTDESSFTKINMDDSWKIEAKNRIKSIRQGNLTVTIQSDMPLKQVKIQIKQSKHEFGFGTAVSSEFLQNNAAYKKWYLNNFEWAVMENDMKWRQTERKHGKYSWENADTALKILKSNGKKVRGHTVFWANKDRNPAWVQAITNKTELYEACMKRASDIVTRYKGRIQHWDVNNEMLATKFYADIYGSSSIRDDMFREVQKLDPKATLFLNDFNIINNAQRLSMYVDQAKRFLAAKVPVMSMGAQGHFYERPLGPVLLKRLDKLATANLPIWITELDYYHLDNQERADALEDALLAFFSHPSVQGVLFWGFYEGRHFRGEGAALVNGEDMKPNAAGLMWQRLFHKDWRTDVTRNLGYLKAGTPVSSSNQVFYGDYQITVSSNGTVIRSDKITIRKAKGKANLSIGLTDSVFG